ncbi:dUTP diphosphatase [Bacillus safensis]|uniref:dUTP diphosphatase n=1 Tax=Bacillus safensis TaxID=561879 RepID=UPI001CF023BE|nr:deoxyuridine 5'-triphosphate nucleotidohydrolase [Bacillus safensis]MCA6607468.1 deoxyuridine 5'-triphosphate nucleotidohydrolase [Bacillus safensis]
MNVNIKRLSADATTPTYAHSTDACFDLYAAADVIIEPGETALVPTGIAFEIPPGYEMQIRPRSGITLNTPLRVQLGTVDSGYAGEVGVIVDNIAHREVLGLDLNRQAIEYSEVFSPEVIRGSSEDEWDYFGNYPNRTYIVRKGDRIAQAAIKPVEQATFTVVDTLEETERGGAGFGSSGVS